MSESPEQQKKPIVAKTEPAGAPETAPETVKVEAPAATEIQLAADECAFAAEPDAPPSSGHRLPHYLAMAASLTVALGLGWAAGHATTATGKPASNPAHQAILAIDWTGLAAGAQKAQADSLRMAADMQAVKSTLAGLKDSVERSKQEAAHRLGQVADRLERGQKADQDVAARLASLSERLEKGEREAAAKLAAIVERLDRIDPGLKTGSIPGQKPQPGAKIEAKLEPKPEQAKASAAIEGWVLREVYDGIALIEGRNKRLVEIAPGEQLPGVGRVESIERRGRSWVVVTTRGIITSQQW